MKLKMILIAGSAAVVVLGGGGFAAYRYLPYFQPKPPATAAKPAPAAAAKPASPAPAPASPPAPVVAKPADAAAAPVAGTAKPVASAGVATARGEGWIVRLYESMKPKEAATVMAKLDPELSTTILIGMKERQAGKILGLLPAEKAADLTSRIARAKSEAPRPTEVKP